MERIEFVVHGNLFFVFGIEGFSYLPETLSRLRVCESHSFSPK